MYIKRIWGYITITLLADKFVYSHHLSFGQCVDIIWRSYMLITPAGVKGLTRSCRARSSCLDVVFRQDHEACLTEL